MVLARFLKQLITAEKPSPVVAGDRRLDEMRRDDRPRVLNVGGGSKSIPIPAHYAGWNHLLLDIDPRGNPDVVCDARELDLLEPNQFDAIYCSHNLEHYYKHDGADSSEGYSCMSLKPDGFRRIACAGHEGRDAGVRRNGIMTVIDGHGLSVSPAGPIAVATSSMMLEAWKSSARSDDLLRAQDGLHAVFTINGASRRPVSNDIRPPPEAALEVRSVCIQGPSRQAAFALHRVCLRSRSSAAENRRLIDRCSRTRRAARALREFVDDLERCRARRER